MRFTNQGEVQRGSRHDAGADAGGAAPAGREIADDARERCGFERREILRIDAGALHRARAGATEVPRPSLSHFTHVMGFTHVMRLAARRTTPIGHRGTHPSLSRPRVSIDPRVLVPRVLAPVPNDFVTAARLP